MAGGATITNTGDWDPELVGIDSTAERVRFRVNGYSVGGGWQGVDSEFDLPRLTYKGMNYIQADVEYQSGVTKTL